MTPSARRYLAAALCWLCAGPCAGQSRAAGPECRDVPLPQGTVYACLGGSGPVTVVLAAGAGTAQGTWAPVVEALRQEARILTFDRPGLGRSPPGPLPRTPTRIAEELHALLTALDVHGPLILVGHSMGGVHVLRYASLHPEGVQAVVTLDTPPPGFEEARLELLTPVEREARRRDRAGALDSARPVVRHEREGSEDPGEWRFPDFPRRVPLTVVVADSQDFGTLGSPQEHRRLWMAESRRWLALSDRSSLVVAEGSGHMIHHHRPALVVDLLRRLLESRASGAARRPDAAPPRP